MKLKEFDYFLPKELIAQKPLEQRDESGLMVLHRSNQKIEHTFFHQLPSYLQRGDVLVANDTRVIPARIYGKKETGGWVEVLLLNFPENGTGDTHICECLLRSRRKIIASSKLFFGPTLTAEILESTANGTWWVRLNYQGDLNEVLRGIGKTPTPPYIKRNRNSPHEQTYEQFDSKHYQTIYAKRGGAVAAPTAGFHFTRPLMEKIKGGGVAFTFLTLHIGYGTFQPLRGNHIENHKLHKEFFRINQRTSDCINRARRKGGRVIAVGTTTARVLETMACDDGTVKKGEGYTDLYIYPGYSFKSMDALITNFHLPRSSLLLLVAAFAGKEFILKAYKEAIEKKYRFFSYGDAMLIV